MGILGRLFGRKNSASEPVASEARAQPKNKIGIQEFCKRVAAIAMDFPSVEACIGRKSITGYEAERLFVDAAMLQWYAVQNFLAIKCTQDNVAGDGQSRIARAFNDVWWSSFEGVPNGSIIKTKMLSKIPEQQPQYDALLASGGERSFLSFGFLLDIGETFGRLAKHMDYTRCMQIGDLGQTVYRNALTRCIKEFDDSCIDATESETVEGAVYTTVKIGNQVWMVENLRTTKYNDGTPIPLIDDGTEWYSSSDNREPAYCLYDNDNINNHKYGALYNWYAVNTGKLAPKGWHVPTDAEWTELEQYLIANGCDEWEKCGRIAQSMGAKTDWKSDSDCGTIGNDLSMNNKSGFSALPGGSRSTGGNFFEIGRRGYWWSASEHDASYAYSRRLSCDDSSLYRTGDLKGFGLSVRLLKD